MSSIPSAYILLLWLIWKRTKLSLLLGMLDLSLGKYRQRQATLPVAQKKHWLQIHKVKEVQHWAFIIQIYICAVSAPEKVHHCPALQTEGGYAHLPAPVHP